MNITSVKQFCGDGICNLKETTSTCLNDCVPKAQDYLLCFINKNGCTSQELANHIQVFTFVIIIGLAIFYIKRRNII